MVFNDTSLGFFILIVLCVWLIILSIAVFRMIRHYNALTLGTGKSGLKEILDAVLQTQKGLEQHTKALYKALEDVKQDGKLHVQRVGLVRFNPFSDTGGSQSFTLALLDGHDNGLVMTSLYARTGHRWYIKEVSKKRGKTLALSKEEQAAIQKATGFDAHE